MKNNTNVHNYIISIFLPRTPWPNVVHQRDIPMASLCKNTDSEHLGLRPRCPEPPSSKLTNRPFQNPIYLESLYNIYPQKPLKLSLQQRGKVVFQPSIFNFQGPYVSFTEAKSILAIRFCTSFHLLMLRNPKKL